MLAANIDREVKEILEKKGEKGWLRVQECANEYAKDPLTKEHNDSRKTKFYRWRKQVEKGRVDGFKVQLLPGNVSFIGVNSANTEVLNEFISGDKKVSRNVKTGLGFFEWRDRVAERKRLEREQKRKQPTANMLRALDFNQRLINHHVHVEDLDQALRDMLTNAGIKIEVQPQRRKIVEKETDDQSNKP